MKTQIYLNKFNSCPLFTKKLLTVIFFLLFNGIVFSQVGINNTDPKASLDISVSDASDPANTDGILIPKIDKFPDTDPGEDQLGMLVFLTTTDGTDLPGFYYWNHPTTSWEWANRIKRIDDLHDGKSDFDGSQDGSSVFLGIDAGAAPVL